jgi:acetyltransferase
MIVREILNPSSIAVIGASNDVGKPGGKVLSNILGNGYPGQIYGVNPKEAEVQGIKSFSTVEELPPTELAIIAIAAKYVEDAVRTLAMEKGTKGFIILSAGFSEVGDEGRELEKRIVDIISSVGGTLIGPNIIGVLTQSYKGVFAGPIPRFDPMGCDCVSASGATMVFILETAIKLGLSFSSIFSVGNSAQIGVEEVLEYWDETFDPETSPKVKLLYMEQIHEPSKLLKHASSLIRKGCRIAAIKAGTTEAGSRAVSSHTGALAGSDTATDALFRKAGIIRCQSRSELVYVAGVLQHKALTGGNLAVITHAGGPGVLLTDELSRGGLKVPKIEGPDADGLLSRLYHGSSVANPIDFLATGTAEQLGDILETIDSKMPGIDGSVVIFGTTGMWDVTNVYDLLNEKMNSLNKPIFAVLPSIVQAEKAVEHFQNLGRISFTDEVLLGSAICRVNDINLPEIAIELPAIDHDRIREIIERNESGYLNPDDVKVLLESAGIRTAGQATATSRNEAIEKAAMMGYPVVMKVVGPVHKSDLGGVRLSVSDSVEVGVNFDDLMKIEGAEAVLIQQMLSGQEIYIGAKREDKFGHLILCGLGGIFIEALKDVSYGLSPIAKAEAVRMIEALRSYPIIRGIRGKEGVNVDLFAEAIIRLSALLKSAPEITEMDINPLLGTQSHVTAVDARINIEK